MASKASRTIIIRDGGIYRRVTKVVIAKDGSYFVVAPYHTAGKAVLMKLTVNYDEGAALVPLEKVALDIASLEDRRLKMTHHPSGFVQYSGDGIVSGIDVNGMARGMAVWSQPLNSIFRGPAFCLVVQGVEQLEIISELPRDAMLFDLDAAPKLPGSNAIVLEGQYFVPMWRRFIRKNSADDYIISVQHPAGPNLELRVMLSGDECEFPGFMGFELYRTYSEFKEPTFTLSGPAEEPRRNEAGQRLADVIMCIYPMPEHPSVPLGVRRSLNYPRRGETNSVSQSP